MLDASLSQPARIGRWLYYQAVKHLPIGGPRIVSEGDSWFQHPTELEIIDWLIGQREGYKIRSLGHAGAWLKEMLEDAEFVDAIREERPKVFLFSGGGCDVLEGFLYSILHESDEFETAQECLDEDSLAHHFDRLEDQFGKVYDMAQKAAGGSIPMIVHGYDYPNPGKKYYGILDWGLGKTLEHRGVQERLWYDVVKLIIDRFNIMLQELAKHRDHMYYVDLRKTLDKTDFVDETHPTSYAARKLAEFRWAIGLPEPTVAPNAQPTRRAPGGAIQTGGPTLIRVTSRLSRAGSAPMARNMCRNTVDGCDLPRPVSSPH